MLSITWETLNIIKITWYVVRSTGVNSVGNCELVQRIEIQLVRELGKKRSSFTAKNN